MYYDIYENNIDDIDANNDDDDEHDGCINFFFHFYVITRIRCPI